MNDSRRKLLKKAIEALETAEHFVDMVLEGEQDSLDNMPESLSESERCIKMESAIELLEEALEHITDAQQNIEDATA